MGLQLSSGCGLGLRFGLLGIGGMGFEAVAVVAGFHDVAVVGEPVEQRGGQLGITEHAGPFGEAEVGGDGETRVFVVALVPLPVRQTRGPGAFRIDKSLSDCLRVEPPRTRRPARGRRKPVANRPTVGRRTLVFPEFLCSPYLERHVTLFRFQQATAV